MFSTLTNLMRGFEYPIHVEYEQKPLDKIKKIGLWGLCEKKIEQKLEICSHVSENR
jgi:hypothetical protein